MIRVRELLPTFLDFWREAQGKSQGEQLKLWEELYASRHPSVFEVYFSPPYWGLRENLSRALQRYVEDMERINKAAQDAGGLIPQVIESTLTAFATNEDSVEMGVVAFVGTYGADGFGFPLAGSTTVFLALEQLAHYEPGRVKALIAHELSHGLHMELRRHVRAEWLAEIMRDPRQLFQFASALLAEGLAVAASKRIIPGLEERFYLFYSPEQWDWCRTSRARLTELALDALNRDHQDDYFRFFTTGEPSEELPYGRSGYYIGCLAVEQLLKQYSLRQLADIEPDEYPGLIRRALVKGV